MNSNRKHSTSDMDNMDQSAFENMKHYSLWNDVMFEDDERNGQESLKSNKDRLFGPLLDRNLEVEVAVVGGGMAGLCTAFLLQESGHEVVVIEADRVGMGVSLNTTAKITSQHNVFYHKLIMNFGHKKALEYAKTNEAAIGMYRKIITKLGIDCDFTEDVAYVYSTSKIDTIKEEVEAAKQLGIEATFETETSLPFKIEGAVCFKNQAHFHPVKFMREIAKRLTIYEESRVTKLVSDDTLYVDVKGKEYQVKAKKIVIATHYPFINMPSYFFARMHQERSYVIALKAPQMLDYGMYIGEDSSGYSFRKQGDYILLGGESHRTGTQLEKEHFSKLIQAANNWYPNAPIEYQWATQDCVTIDEIPYIGPVKEDSNVYVATGFKKWGMTSSMVAAMLIRQDIEKGYDFANSVYSPQRFKLQASKKNLIDDLTTSVTRYTLQKIMIPKDTFEDIQNGHGGIVRYHGHKIGVYKDEEGNIYGVSVKCPHLGCLLAWNQEEKTWDCPCHGSRFDYKGQLINNPAQASLEEY